MKNLAIVFAVALLIRLVALGALLPQLKPGVDLDSYRGLARSLAAGKGFVATTPDGRELPNVARTPVYPIFLAALMKLGGDRLGLFLAVQCVLGAATCVLTGWLARRWLSVASAIVAGLLVALDPNSVVRCADLRTETLFTLLLVAGTCLLVWRIERLGVWLLAGLLWSLAALTRPIAVWLWVLPLAFMRRDRIAPVAAFLLGYLVVLGIWSGRNNQVTGKWFVSSIATHNLLLYRAAGVEAAKDGLSLEAVQTKWRQEYGDVQWCADANEFREQLRSYRRRAMEVLAGSPATAAMQAAIGCGKLLFGPGGRSLDASLQRPAPPSPWWNLYGVALAVVTAFAVSGIWRLKSAAILPVALVLYFILLAGGPEANSRFRTPITPLLAVLAVAGAEFRVRRLVAALGRQDMKRQSADRSAHSKTEASQ